MSGYIRKVIIFGIFFFSFFVLVNLVFTIILIKTDWDVKKRIESINFIDPGFDLLVLGNSLSEYGVDTELLTSYGIRAYNLSIIGNPVSTSYFQLNEYLENYSYRPKYVLLCYNSVLDTLDSDTMSVHPIVDFTSKDRPKGFDDIPVHKFRWLGREIIKKMVSARHRKARLSNGQIKWEKTTHDDSSYRELYFKPEEYQQSKWIGEIVKLCRENHIEIFLINMPAIKQYQNLDNVGPYEIYFDNGDSAYLFNFNSQNFCKQFDDDKDWIGRSHFNETGAAKFTKELQEILCFQVENAKHKIASQIN